MKKFEIIPHTADVGLRVFGQDLKELFSQAAQGMFSLMISVRRDLESEEERELEVSGLSLEELLVHWLSELLYKLVGEHWLVLQTEILGLEEKNNKFFLVAQVEGKKIDYKSFPMKREIKAVTYHNLAIKKTAGGYKVEIIFDV